MMDFGLVEIEIVDLLNTKITDPDVEVVALGENDADYTRPFGKSTATVAFSTEEPSPTSSSLDIVNQETTVIFSVLIQSRNIRGEKGIYYVANLVKKYLIGYQPQDGDAFKYAGMRFEQKVKNGFEYSLDFRTRGMAIQEVIEEAGPQFKQVTYLES